MQSIAAGNWFLIFAVVAFPFLDWPWLPGTAYVRPLAMYAIIFGLIALPLFYGRGHFHRIRKGDPFTIFSGFVFFAILITMIRMLLAEFQGSQYVLIGFTFRDFGSRAIFSVLSGWCMYLFFIAYASKLSIAISASRAAIVAGYISVFFVLIQSASLYFGLSVAEELNDLFLRLFHHRGGQPNKPHGLAPEASLLADFMMTISVPFALAALTSRFSPFSQGKITVVEFVLLFGSLTSLLMSRSRIGLISLIMLVLFLFFVKAARGAISLARTRGLAIVLGVSGVLLLIFSVMTDLILEPVSTIATPDAFEQEGGSVSNVTRLAHLVAGVTMFLDFPLGVGLGGFPFHYANYVPEWALWSPEVQSFLGRATTVLIPEIALPTPKSMLPKILSETGILGGALFSWFFFSMFRNALRAATTSREPEVRYLAFASVYALVGIVSFSFNSDSFVMPHYYFVFAVAGLVGGMSLASNAGKVRKPPSAA